jgi:hypothetical protein
MYREYLAVKAAREARQAEKAKAALVRPDFFTAPLDADGYHDLPHLHTTKRAQTPPHRGSIPRKHPSI